jgi:hypothetical protein
VNPPTGQSVVPSESKALRLLVKILANVRAGGPVGDIGYVEDKLEQMATNAAAGRHANPALVTFGNPGSGRIQAGEGETLGVYLNKLLGFVETLEYERVRAPEGYYFHDFGLSDSLWTATLADGQQVVLLANVNGRPLWGKR